MEASADWAANSGPTSHESCVATNQCRAIKPKNNRTESTSAAQALARTNLCVACQGNMRTSNTAISRSGQNKPAIPKARDSCTARDKTKWFIPHSNAMFQDGNPLKEV